MIWGGTKVLSEKWLERCLTIDLFLLSKLRWPPKKRKGLHSPWNGFSIQYSEYFPKQTCPNDMTLPKILTQYCPKNIKLPEILTQNRPKYMKLPKILPEIWIPYTNRGSQCPPDPLPTSYAYDHAWCWSYLFIFSTFCAVLAMNMRDVFQKKELYITCHLHHQPHTVTADNCIYNFSLKIARDYNAKIIY